MDANKMLADMWKHICEIQKLIGAEGFGSSAWITTGNPSVTEDQFLGTINDQDLTFKTFNTERARLTRAGLFGIGTSSPSVHLDIDGQIRIRGGSPGAGKILQSDANGVGTWETIPSATLAARNGATVNNGFVVLGQDIGEASNPGILLSNRQIPTQGFSIQITGTGRVSIGRFTTGTPNTTLDTYGNFSVTAAEALGFPSQGFQSNLPGTAYVSHGTSNWGFVIARADDTLSAPNMTFYKSQGNDLAVRVPVSAGVTLGRIGFQGVTSNSTVSLASSIVCQVATVGAGFITSNIQFIQTTSVGLPYVAMVLAGDGVLFVTTLSSGATPPVTSGTTKMVICDSAGKLSFTDIPVSGGASIGGTVTGGTTGSILFVGSSSVLAQDNPNLFWDDTNNRLAIGNTAPTRPLDVSGIIRATYAGINQAIEIFNSDRVISSGGAGHIDIGTGLVSICNTGGAAPSTTSQLYVNGSTTITSKLGVGLVSTPTAKVHIAAGSATVGTAPLKLTAGTNLTTPEDGAFEFDGTNLYFTVGGVRKTVTLV